MRGGHTNAGARHARVCEVEDMDPTPLEQISWSLHKAKPGKWPCVQARELWSPKEETHVRAGQIWLLKFGKVAGSMSCVEKEFKLGPRKYEEYKGVRFANGDCAFLVDV